MKGIDALVMGRLTFEAVLGGGVPLFGPLPGSLAWEHVSTEILLGALVKTRYRRKR